MKCDPKCYSPLDKTLDRRAFWGPDGWPAADFQFVSGLGQPNMMRGRHLLQFRGKAAVRLQAVKSMGEPQFMVAGQQAGSSVPAGVGYDPTQNLTRLEFDYFCENRCSISFKETQRAPESPMGSGLSEVVCLRPLEPDAQEYHPVGTRTTLGYRDYIGAYVVNRFYQSNGEWEWADRKLPGTAGSQLPDELSPARRYPEKTWGRFECLEDYILIANETGRDLYLVIGSNPSADYLRRYAQAIQFGTDGKEPYLKPTGNPVYPPLNPTRAALARSLAG